MKEVFDNVNLIVAPDGLIVPFVKSGEDFLVLLKIPRGIDIKMTLEWDEKDIE